MTLTAHATEQANAEALNRINTSEPVLVDIRPAIEVVPGMTRETVLTSGAPLHWDEYTGGQRAAVIGGALFEGLANTAEEADAKLRAGDIRVDTCHAHDCVGSVAGIFTASMPVFVVDNAPFETRAFCNFFEGPSPRRLNYGSYDESVKENLQFVHSVIAGVIGDAVRASGGIPLGSMMRRAVHMGDELHSRNTAATLLFTRELFPALLDWPAARRDAVKRTLAWVKESDYFFLRLSMAAAKAMINAAHGIERSSVVTGLTMDCLGFSLRVSGLGEHWFRGPHLEVDGRFFEGYSAADLEWIGGESLHAESVGLGGFAQAAAFALQAYQGGSAEAMVELNRQMYSIAVGESTRFQIPFFGYRGSPTGIDILKVVETGITPVFDAGLAGKGGGQIGAGIVRAPLAPFKLAADAFERTYAAQPAHA